MTTNSEDIEEKLPAEETAETLEAAEAEAPAQAGEPAQAAPEEVEEDISAALEKELLETKDRLLRTMAEYDNHRKRTVREKEALRADIITNVTSEFLPVMDNLQRALDAECSDEKYKEGVRMIYDSFMGVLKKLGVEEIESDGADFNPQLHQAVQRIDSADVESGKVAQTFAKGYKIGDKVIRFAMVAVAN
ncbi:MAG: nucleotide exchange factor GrpE [Oscillospiraceae bacterium]|nr:nucleotide exchange factor GrpE [Oscillospiraceae bacterium]